MRDFSQFVTRSNSYSALDEVTVTEKLAGPTPTEEEQLINIGRTGQTEAQPKPEAYHAEEIEGQIEQLSKDEDQQLRVVIISSEVLANPMENGQLSYLPSHPPPPSPLLFFSAISMILLASCGCRSSIVSILLVAQNPTSTCVITAGNAYHLQSTCSQEGCAHRNA